ncbi:MAG: PAS domain S-box protein, partial [Thermoanaerobaculia bacterium]
MWLPLVVAWGAPRAVDEPHPGHRSAVAGGWQAGEGHEIEPDLEGSRRPSRAFPAVIVTGVLAAIGVYHLLLFAVHRRRLEYLWLGLLALDFAALTWLGDGWAAWSQELSGGLERRWMAVLAHLGAMLFIRFFADRLARRFDRWVRLGRDSHGVIAVALIFTPLSWIDASEPLRWLWGLPLLAILLPVLRQGVRAPEPEDRIASVSVLAIPLAIVADLSLAAGGASWSLPLPGTGFLLWAGAVWLSVSGRFTRAHRELDRFRQQLEKMAEDRTDELTTTHRKLEAQVGERRLVEDAMRMLERAVEQSIDGIAVTDLSGSTQFINEAWARLHGYEVFEVLGYDLTLFHTPEQMQEQVYPLMSKVRERGAFEGEVWHRRKDGETFPTWMSVTRLQDPGDEPVGMVIIVRDVSERRKAAEERLRLESQLLQAEKLESLAKLAAGIAHDYNNLLTG